jgi:N6-adenosine-specific RNA methylase IME4
LTDIDLSGGPYSCIVADPPWPVRMTGKMAGRHAGARELPYETMTIDEIEALDVGSHAADGAHCWLWTTNGFWRPAFDVMQAWGFKYMTTITWVKPSGYGPWFASTTQHVLFGYKGKCVFPLARYKPTHFMASPRRKHSRKPDEFYDLVRSISPEPRIDLFNRREIDGFEGWGDESPVKSA